MIRLLIAVRRLATALLNHLSGEAERRQLLLEIERFEHRSNDLLARLRARAERSADDHDKEA